MLIDVNSWIGRWPFQQIGPWSLQAMTETLERAGVTVACVASIEGVLLPDAAPAERELANVLSKHRSDSLRLIHSPLICAGSAQWKSDLAEARDCFGAKMVRIAPSYRPAESVRLAELIRTAHDMGICVAVVMRLEDARTQSRLINASPVSVADIAELAASVEGIRLLVLNALMSEVKALSTSPAFADLYFDTAMLDGPSPLSAATKLISGRLVFGTAAPLLEPTANTAKLRQANLSPNVFAEVASENAQRLARG